MNRRSFIRGIAGASLFSFAAPAIVHAASIMPVRAIPAFQGYGGWAAFDGTFAVPQIVTELDPISAMLDARINDATTATIEQFSSIIWPRGRLLDTAPWS